MSNKLFLCIALLIFIAFGRANCVHMNQLGNHAAHANLPAQRPLLWSALRIIKGIGSFQTNAWRARLHKWRQPIEGSVNGIDDSSRNGNIGTSLSLLTVVLNTDKSWHIQTQSNNYWAYTNSILSTQSYERRDWAFHLVSLISS